MTDAEKMLNLMLTLGKEEQEKQQADCDNMGRIARMMYDGYVKAGFSPKMAFEMTKAILVASIEGAMKK